MIEVTVPDVESITRLAEIFAVMGNPTRLRILTALSHAEMGVGDLAKAADISESATSHQLRLLRTMHIVRARKHGREVSYSLDDQHVHDLLDLGMAHIRHK